MHRADQYITNNRHVFTSAVAGISHSLLVCTRMNHVCSVLLMVSADGPVQTSEGVRLHLDSRWGSAESHRGSMTAAY
jgi:hypothetical protein